jgi:hypothetical protein
MTLLNEMIFKLNIQPVCVYAQADIQHEISNDEGKTAAKP